MHFDVERWDNLIAELHQSVLHPDLLADAVAVANTALESDLCHIVGFTPEGKETIRVFTEKNLGRLGEMYAEYYTRIDPRRSFIETARVGAAYRCSAFYNDKFVSNNEFYQDFLIPEGFRYVIGSCLFRSAVQSIFVAFNHGNGRTDFSADEEYYVGRYIGHLSKVVSGIVRLAPVAHALESETALDALGYGVAGISVTGRISYTNAVADRLLATQLHGELARGRLRDGGALYDMVLLVMGDGVTRSRQNAGHDDASSALFVTAVRMNRTSPTEWLAGGVQNRTDVLLIISEGRAFAPPSASQLTDLFGLTPAEARLAWQLACGMSIGAYADTFCVSVATARTQLRAVLRKTGQSRQQDLLRLFASVPNSRN